MAVRAQYLAYSPIFKLAVMLLLCLAHEFVFYITMVFNCVSLFQSILTFIAGREYLACSSVFIIKERVTRFGAASLRETGRGIRDT